MSCLPGHCRTSEELKYTMTRLAVDGADLFIVEHSCAANIKVTQVFHSRTKVCNVCIYYRSPLAAAKTAATLPGVQQN